MTSGIFSIKAYKRSWVNPSSFKSRGWSWRYREQIKSITCQTSLIAQIWPHLKRMWRKKKGRRVSLSLRDLTLNGVSAAFPVLIVRAPGAAHQVSMDAAGVLSRTGGSCYVMSLCVFLICIDPHTDRICCSGWIYYMPLYSNRMFHFLQFKSEKKS